RGLRESVAGLGGPLYSMVRYHLGFDDGAAGYSGKALRPSLLLFAHEALGGEPEKALPAAVALELVHSFSLVHDDIQDRDEERHGRPTVWRAIGPAQAINVGDALRELSALALLKLQGHFPAEVVLRASLTLDRATLEMIEGQWLDLAFEEQDEITVQDYLGMVERKTGALLGAALEIGALLAGAGEQIIGSFRRCGRELGLAFQIRDDLLGCWGDRTRTGKSTGNDILRRKKSLPIVCAIHSPRGDELRRIYRRAPSEADLPRVLEILDGARAREEAEALAEEYCDRALAELEGVKLPRWAADGLEELAQFLLRRER
ncbi:MAG: polyprenyl synthetase family protein, partial [Candidatus Bipolaricaulia bacterium]